MFPEIAANLDKLNTEIAPTDGGSPLGAAFLFDFTKGRHTIVDGRMVDCSSDEAITQWIELVLRTEPDTYRVYTEDEAESFGVHTRKYIGLRNYPLGFIASELKREITEQLTANRFISRIEDFSAVKENRDLLICFTAVLVSGGRLVKEWVIGGL